MDNDNIDVHKLKKGGLIFVIFMLLMALFIWSQGGLPYFLGILQFFAIFLVLAFLVMLPPLVFFFIAWVIVSFALDSGKSKKGSLQVGQKKQPVDISNNIELTSKQKGDMFEHYVIHKFDSKYFLLKDMRSDKGSNGIYPESNQYPDLIFEYKPKSFEFAAECKWRSNWWQGSDKKYWIDCMGGDHKLEVYNRFSQQKNMPVWIVLGISGQPNNPAELYVIPLHIIKYRYAEYEYLQSFRHQDVARNFYLDTRYYTFH